MKLEKISVTQIKKARDCEMSLFHTLTQPKPLKTNVWLFIGSCFHSVLEIYFKNKAKGKINTWVELVPILDQIFNQNKITADFSKIPETQAKHIVYNYLYEYYVQRCPVLFPKDKDSIEIFMRFTAKQNDRQILITGKADLITKDLTCIDHKSGHLRNPENEPQAYLYPIGLKSSGLKINGFQFSVVNQKECKVFEVPFDQVKANQWLSYAFELKNNYPDNLLVNHRNCPKCEWNNGICREAK